MYEMHSTQHKLHALTSSRRWRNPALRSPRGPLATTESTQPPCVCVSRAAPRHRPTATANGPFDAIPANGIPSSDVPNERRSPPATKA